MSALLEWRNSCVGECLVVIVRIERTIQTLLGFAAIVQTQADESSDVPDI